VLVVAAAVVVSLQVVAPRSATSAVRLDTSLATALMQVLVDMVVVAVDMAETRADTEEEVVVDLAVDAKVDRPATLAVVTATCLVTAPRVRSATTVVR
jgi:hypothetical protein